MILDNKVAFRISMLRFILIAVVVFLHIATPPSLDTLEFSNVLEVLRAFTQSQLGLICVPALTMISGYLLFSSNLDLAPIALYRKKARTLLVPFFFFNICYFILTWAVEYFTGYVAYKEIKNESSMAVINMLFGLTSSPLNNALHFLRDLFVLILLSPIIGMFLRRAPLIGLVIVGVLFLFDQDRHLIMRNTMAVMFYLGGMAAICKWNILKYDKQAVPCLIGLLVLCAMIIFFRVEDKTIIYITAPILVWPMASLIQDTSFGVWAEKHSKYSFFIFLAHIPVIGILRRIYRRYDDAIPEIFFVYFVPLFLIAFLIQTYKFMYYWMPETFSIMIGGRARKSEAASG